MTNGLESFDHDSILTWQVFTLLPCVILNCLGDGFYIAIIMLNTVGNVQALGANGKAAFSPKAHG